MTPDELVSVIEDILEDLTVADLRRGTVKRQVPDDLSDSSWGVLIRFLGGERLEMPQPMPSGSQSDVPERTWTFDEDGNPVDTGVRPPPVRTVTPTVRRDPDEPLKLKGEFDGVELP